MKLKRLVSAVLAVGMALTMLPTAAFAAWPRPTTYVNHLKFNGNEPDLGTTQPDKNGTYTVDKTYKWSYSDAGTGYKLDLTGLYDPTHQESDGTSVPDTVPCEVRNSGTIIGGTFWEQVHSFGTIEGGTYKKVRALGAYPLNGSVIQEFEETLKSPGCTVSNCIIWNKFTYNTATVENSLLCVKPDNYTGTCQVLSAEGCSIIPDITSLPGNVAFSGQVYILGTYPCNTFIVKNNSVGFNGWTYGSELDSYIQKIDGKTLKVTMPADGSDLTITSDIQPIPFVIGENGRPVDPNGDDYDGTADIDGWHYTSGKKADDAASLTIYENGSVDFGKHKVDWKIDNYGTMEGGIFNGKDTVINEETGTIKNGEFNTSVKNSGTIDDGVFNYSVNNYGTVNGGTFTNTYNGTKGTTNGGVFPRVSTFEDGVNTTWVALNNCTINGISGMAGIVGKQTVTVKADTGFKCWSVSGDTDFALTEEQKYNPELTLTLNGEDKGNIILTAQTEEGYYRLNLTDGKAYSATADGAKDQEINAAKPGDTVILEADASLIPDGMVFDRWEVTGDTELTGNFDAKAEKTSFTMPKSEVTLRAMYRMADQPEEPNVLGTVAMVATAGVGAAVVGYTGYMIGTELYLNTVLPEGTAIPNNTTELAKLLWTDAGKPAPAAVLAADATDEQKALTWAVENQLISADKAADASVGRWEVIDAWNKAQEMKKV